MASVLIIEDEAPLTRMMAVFLVGAGYEVASVESAPAALDRLADYAADVIVFNTVIGDDEKAELIADLRQRSPGSKILDVSAEKTRLARGIIQEMPKASDAPRARGADGYLDLPFEATMLLGAVAALISGESAPTPSDVIARDKTRESGA